MGESGLLPALVGSPCLSACLSVSHICLARLAGARETRRDQVGGRLMEGVDGCEERRVVSR